MSESESLSLASKRVVIPRNNEVVPPITRHSGSSASGGSAKNRSRPGHYLMRLRQHHKTRNRILTATSLSPNQSS
jgi:hypothetical protein